MEYIPSIGQNECKRWSIVKKTDIVIIGAGAAGLTAAVEAERLGAEVVVLEKMPKIGGNSLRATGGINAANTSIQKKQQVCDSIELFIQDTLKGGKNKNNIELVKTLAKGSADAVRWLQNLGADLNKVSRAGGSRVSRTHKPGDGKAAGPVILSALLKATRKYDIPIKTQNTVKAILIDDFGKIRGVLSTEGEKHYVLNTKAIIIATGGFAANSDLVAKYKPELAGYITTNHSGATGDGILMAEKIGAKLVDLEQIQTHPTVTPTGGIMITESLRGEGAILVNLKGKRFVRELDTRDVVSQAILEQEKSIAFLLFDDQIADNIKTVKSYFKKNLVIEGNNIRELANSINVNPDILKYTIDEYNCNYNNKYFEKGKFYAIEVTPAIHHTMGGVMINSKTEVINKDNKIIKGLFAAGEVIGGVHGAERLGGNAMTEAIVFGKIAGENASYFVKNK